MQLKCRSAALGCADPVMEYTIIRKEDNQIEGAFCAAHGKDASANPPEGYRIEKIPAANVNQDPPLRTKPQPRAAHSPAPAQKGPPTMADPIAPPWAVSDDEAQPEDLDDAREPQEPDAENQAALDFENREERKVLAEEMSANFRAHIGRAQIYDVQITLRGGYASEDFRRYVKKLVGDIEFASQSGFRGTVRPAPGAEVTVTPAPAPGAAAPPPAAPRASGPPAPGPAAPAQSQATSGEFVAAKLEITPTAKGTTQVKFFTQGAQKPALSYTRRPENLVPIFEGCGDNWQAAHFNTAGEYTVRYLVRWENSENKAPSGVYYRNIVSISPA